MWYEGSQMYRESRGEVRGLLDGGCLDAVGWWVEPYCWEELPD